MLKTWIRKQLADSLNFFSIFEVLFLFFHNIADKYNYHQSFKYGIWGKDLAAKVFHGKKDKLLYILELSYKKYYNLLYNYGLKLTNDSELVQDFIQEIFTKLCKRENIDNISNIKIYLLRAMRNIIYDYYAAQKDIVSIDDMEFLIPDNDEVFKTFFSKNDEELQKYQTLLQTINSLPNQQKQILYLFYIKGLTHKEISEVLDINPQSSMNSLAKSIRKLRIQFGQISEK